MNYTKDEWEHTEDGVIVAEDGKQIASVFPRDREANANLIVAAVNACIKLNPDNPMAAAKSIPEMYEVCEQLADWDAGKFGKESKVKIIEISKRATQLINLAKGGK